jgi:hypothetical protein
VAIDPEWARAAATRIRLGHAFESHVLAGDHFPEVRTRAEFADLIYAILTDRASLRRALRSGREAFWSNRYGAIVVLDPRSEDAGTAFRPGKGIAYFLAIV